MHETVTLAEFAAQMQYNELPKEALIRTKTCILDLLGVGLFGSKTQWGRIMTDYVTSLGGKTESTILGQDLKVPTPCAAIANGTMAHGYELDDTHNEGRLHPGAVIIPAALAVGEREHATGEDMIKAVAVGYEVMIRIGKAAYPGTQEKGFHSTATCGPFGAAAAAGSLLHLSVEQMVNAFGIAGAHSAGTKEFYKEGPMTKRLYAGRAAENGVVSALLAQRGFTGPSTILEGKYGYFELYSGKYDLVSLTTELGKKFAITKVSFKPYPFCGSLHAALEAATKLANSYKIGAENIEQIIVGTFNKVVEENVIYNPTTMMAAQYSLPISVALPFFNIDPSKLTEEKLKDEKILGLANRVRAVLDSEIIAELPERQAARVTVRLKNGAKYTEKVLDSKGRLRNPMTTDELQGKFRNLASKVLAHKQVQGILRTVNNMEQLKDLCELTIMLTPLRKL